MRLCASYGLGCGTGRRRTQSGHRGSGGRRRCPRARSMTASACFCSTRSRCRMRSLRSREREPVIVLTAPWHERDARTLVERLDATLFAPPPDTAQDLIDKYGITAEEAGGGSPDLGWVRDGGDTVHWYGPGDRLPVGIEAHAGREHNDLV